MFMRAGWVIVLGLLLIPAGARAAAAADPTGSAAPARLRIVDLRGTPYEMGKIHGQTLRAEIHELVKRWKADLEKAYKAPAEDVIRGFLKKTDFRPAIERWTPGLLDEVRGIADGAGVDLDTMYAYQLIDEFWAMGPDLSQSKCTSFAAWGRNGRPALVAQTLDIPTFYHGFQTVLRIHDDQGDLETLVFTVPGILGANGLNSRSVGLCVNAVTQLAYSTKGLPVDFVVRGVLRQKSYEDAVRFLRDIQPAAPQTYVVGGPGQAAVYERSAGKMVRFVPFAGAGFSYHTNHPMSNDDLRPGFREMLAGNKMTLESYQGQCPRFNYMSRLFKDNSAVIDLDVLQALFMNRASGINNDETYGCTIMVLGEKPELHIAPGRPDEAPFQILGFSARSER